MPTCASAGTTECAAPAGCTPNCAHAGTEAARVPCAGSLPSCAKTPPFLHHRPRPRPGRWPAGSSPRPASSPKTTAPRSPRSPPAARSSPRPGTWSASSPTCSATVTASTWKPGPANPKPAPVSELRGFSKGLRKDWAAATARLTVPYSPGAVEGHVNRIKMIKRQMYGRANPDLLCKRVQLADWTDHDNRARATSTWPLTGDETNRGCSCLSACQLRCGVRSPACKADMSARVRATPRGRNRASAPLPASITDQAWGKNGGSRQ
jgi:hypothetical protein